MSARGLLLGLGGLVVLGTAGWLVMSVLRTPPDDEGATTAKPTTEPERVRVTPAAQPLVEDDSGGAEPEIVDDRPGVNLMPAPEGGAPWFRVAGYEDVLDEIDWEEMGAVHAELAQTLNRLANERARGGEPPEEVGVSLGRLYQRMFAVSAPLIDRLPTFNDTTVAGHPAFAANCVAGALHTRGIGLDVDQGRALGKLALDHSRENASRVAATVDQPFLSRAISEAEQRERFFDALESSLTTTQSRVLHSSIAHRRVGLDRFSAALVWDGLVMATLCNNEETAVEAATTTVLMGSPTDPERFKRAMAIVRARIRMLPEEVVYGRRGWLNQTGHLREPDVRDGAGWTLATMRAVMADFAQGRFEVRIPPDVEMRPVVFVSEPTE